MGVSVLIGGAAVEDEAAPVEVLRDRKKSTVYGTKLKKGQIRLLDKFLFHATLNGHQHNYFEEITIYHNIALLTSNILSNPAIFRIVLSTKECSVPISTSL